MSIVEVGSVYWCRSFSGNLTAELYWFLYSGFQFAFYEHVHNITKNLPGSSFISGAVSAGLTTLCTYPCDIMRTRFVYQGEDKMYRHILSGMYTIAKKEGFTGLYKVSAWILSPHCFIG